MTRIIPALSDVSSQYDALFVDLWGCVHDGVTAIPSAVDALKSYKKTGGCVVLVTNSPQPREGVEIQLERFGVPQECWDTIATSGDAARGALGLGVVGEKVWFMGEWARDARFFEPVDFLDSPVTVARVPLEEAEGIVCCGPFDPMADPSTLRPELLYAKQKGLKLLCANPDIVVDRGETREWCAGAVAKLYSEMGGESLYFGKPYPPIYDLARRRLAACGRDVADGRILAIGDGIGTDIKGARGEDIDSLFVTGGLARSETKTSHQPDPDALTHYLSKKMISPTYAIGQLR